ncbi:MAG: hypothetical protein V2B14_03295 [bacterium]
MPTGIGYNPLGYSNYGNTYDYSELARVGVNPRNFDNMFNGGTAVADKPKKSKLGTAAKLAALVFATYVAIKTKRALPEGGKIFSKQFAKSLLPTAKDTLKNAKDITINTVKHPKDTFLSIVNKVKSFAQKKTENLGKEAAETTTKTAKDFDNILWNGLGGGTKEAAKTAETITATVKDSLKSTKLLPLKASGGRIENTAKSWWQEAIEKFHDKSNGLI